MSAKKRIVIALCSIVVVGVMLTASLIAVLSSFNATASTSSFKISYTAQNVQATVVAKYGIGTANTTITTTDGDSVMTFTGNELEEKTTKSFNSVSNITLGKEDVLIIHYAITNTDTSGNASFRVALTSTINTNTNLSVKYAASQADLSTLLYDTWDELYSHNESLYGDIGGGDVANIFIRIEIKDKAQDATFEGNFEFELILNE